VKHLLKIRYLAAVVSVLSILHALAFMAMGTRTAVHAYAMVLRGESGSGAQRPGIELLHSLDFLLVGLVLIMLAFGVAKLFLLSPKAVDDDSLPNWLHVDSFSDLKFLLWETILTALLILALSVVTSELLEKMTWTALVVPAVILMLAISLHLMRRH
jgi:uncharacterized membrane protein YqhA